MPFSAAQLKAIQIRDHNVIVSASAGSGKTSVLVERLSSLVIQDRMSIDSILAMTFTNDAAAEMKARLKKDLQNKPKDDYISNQLTLLETASICTIDSFCQNLVKTYYYKIPISLTMATTVGSESMLHKAFEKALCLAMDEYPMERVMDLKLYFKAFGKDDTYIQKVIEQIIDVANSKSNADEWFDSILSNYQNLDEKSVSWFFQFFKEKIEAMIDVLYSFIEKVEEMEFKKESTKEKILENLKKKKELNFNCLHSIEKQDYEGFKKAFVFSIEKTENIPGTINKIKFDEKEEYLSFQNMIASVLFDLDVFKKDIVSNQNRIQTLVDLSKSCQHHYSEIKKEMEIIDFNDMEHFALALLKDPVIAEELRNKYNAILIDEFQDTNELQETIVSLFCRDNNVFRVGDIKQSIYGFRQAKPSIMKNHMNSKNPKDCALILEENYRSNQSIIEFNNDFYQKIMNSELLGCQFEDIDIAKVGMKSQVDSLKHPIRFYYSTIDEIKEQYDLSYPKAKKLAENHRYHLIAQSILKDIQNGRQFKDICILLRNRTRLKEIKETLEAYNIPVFAQVTSGFFTNNAVQIVCACLCAFINPYDDISLMACLVSPLFGISYSQITQACLEKENTSLFETIKDQDFMIPFLSFLKNKEKTISELIRMIYGLNDFYWSHTTSQDKTNLDYLLEMAANYLYPFDINGFIQNIEEESKMDTTGQANAFGKEENVVRIMTMHASKGLQFPVVYICSSTQMKSLKNEVVMVDSDLGISLMSLDYENRTKRVSLYSLAFQTKAIHEALMEEMRILYVATTRAKEELIFVDCIKSDSSYQYPLNTRALLSLHFYTSWLFHIYRNDTRIQFIKNNHLVELEKKDPVSSLSSFKSYQKESQAFGSYSASMAKKNLNWPSLHSSQGAMDRGTLFHEMAGQLSYPYQREDVLMFSHSHGFSLKEKDLNQFLSLNDCIEYREWMQCEHQFELSYILHQDNQVIHGFMDFVCFSKDIIILDFKTDALNEASLLSTYKQQLLTYQQAMKSMYPNLNVFPYIYSFFLKKMIPVVE
ncbi:MAG: UvrD-helicase domain-containing protein [Floccifex sp.]